MFGSRGKTASIKWTDTQTGKQSTTEVTVFPQNGGSFKGDARGAIAGAELGGMSDTDRVQIDNITPKD